MSRLTLPHYGGKGHYMRCSEQFGCSGECADCEELDKIVEKLAEYEDKEERKPSNHGDRIRAMSDEELANVVVCPHCKTNWDKCTDDCFACRLEWLQQPAEDATNENISNPQSGDAHKN